LLVTISLFCWLIFLLFFNYDRCRYRNCLLLFISLCSTVPAVCSLAGENAPRVFYFCVLLFCIALLIVPVFLIHNGILMTKREGRSLANMLSLLLGLVIGFGEVSTFLFLLWVQKLRRIGKTRLHAGAHGAYKLPDQRNGYIRISLVSDFHAVFGIPDDYPAEERL
jgi:hypothetical protein